MHTQHVFEERMSTSKHFDKICIAVIVLAVIITAVFMNGASLGIQPVSGSSIYEKRLFDTSYVHKIDIVMDNYEEMCALADKNWYECQAVIDGEKYANIAIRIKGNPVKVQAQGGSKYSFKIEFDHKNHLENYHGLDKLDLNNFLGDSTFMKDFMVYETMAAAGVPAPLASYAFVTVNGQDAGLYLAVESVEDAFLLRNFGKNYGNLYKPECEETTYEMVAPAGDAAGAESSLSGTDESNEVTGLDVTFEDPMEHIDPSVLGEDVLRYRASAGQENIDSEVDSQHTESTESGDSTVSDSGTSTGDSTGDENPASYAEAITGTGDVETATINTLDPDALVAMVKPDDIKLIYIDDEPLSYPNIFNNAKQNNSTKDRMRLIKALRIMNMDKDVSAAVDIDEVLAYFAVHNFVVSWNSYTGETAANYYLYEHKGKLSMLPWDYSSAFGTYRSQDAQRIVNYPIDTPLMKGLADERPMFDWIMRNPEYVKAYHNKMRELVTSYAREENIAPKIRQIEEMLTPYIERDTHKFTSETAFHKGVSTLIDFWDLRIQSVLGQLDGEIPSTYDEQNEAPETLIDASKIELIDMK